MANVPGCNLRVYPLPPVLLTNPYLDLLYAHMPPWVRPRRLRPTRRAIGELLVEGEGGLLHLHFFDELCQRPGRGATVVGTLGFIALLDLLRTRGIPIVWTAHNDRPHETFYPGWARFAYRAVARRSSAVIAHSRAAAEVVVQSYAPTRLPFVIPQGHYIGVSGPPVSRKDARVSLGLDPNVPILLNLGTLRPYKGLELLLDAFASLPADVAHLLIVGSVKSSAYARSLAERVERTPGARLFAEYVPDAEMPRYVGAADVVVLPYRHMLTSAMLQWAMSYGRAVIAPSFGPVAELVREGHEGFLYAPDDRDSLVAAMQRALAHPDLDALGQAALERVRFFSWPRVAAQTALVYAEAALHRSV